jgi:hypothetical protein
MKVRPKSHVTTGKARRVPLEVETLEARVVPCTDELGVGDLNHSADRPLSDPYPAIVAPQPTGTTSSTTSTTTAMTGLPLPVLNSLPGASATLYLNFTGDFVSSWLGYSNISTPAFDTDGDGAALSQTEVTTITQIWQVVAENYAPFKINVSTVDPRTVSGYTGTVSQIDVGGNGSWTGGTYGGLAQVGGLSGSSANNPVRGFVFPNNLGNGNVFYTGEAISHESGHTMGLQHQAAYSGTTQTSQYQQGPGDGTAPILGVSYYATRGMWWYGQSALGSTSYQDDMAVISSNFGYRPDEAGSTASTASPLTVAGTQVSASGITSTMSDVDAWSFTTGAGSVSFSVSAPSYGNLHPKIELLDSSGNVVAGWQDPDSGTVSWTGTLAAGSYEVVVASHGISRGASATNYGFDVGTYSITGSLVASTTVVAAPTNLAATATSSSQINLTWTDNATNETSYSVERSSDGTTWSQITTLGANSTSYSDTGLAGGTKYYYRVRAFNGTIASAYSNEVSATTATIALAAPSNLAANALSGTQIQLSWTDNTTSATGYSVERSTDGTTWSQITTLGGTSTSYTDSSLASGTKYYYRVRAFSGTTYSVYSNQASATTTVTLVTNPPAAPSNLTATPLSGTQIRLTWTDNSTNETGFYIERAVTNRRGSLGSYTRIATVGANVTSYSDGTVVSGKSYSYRIRAYNSAGTSAYSNMTSKVAGGLTVRGAGGLALGSGEHSTDDGLAGLSGLLTSSAQAGRANAATDSGTHFSTPGALQIEADTIRDYLTTLLGSSPTQTLFRSLARTGRSGNQAALADNFNDLFQFVISP